MRAQESRRILDRLYGYTLSPVLWKKVQTGLSAGRVQSVAVRLIVEREEERLRVPRRRRTGISKRSSPAEGREFTGDAGAPRRRRASPPARTSTRNGVLDRQERARCSPRPTAAALVDALDRTPAVDGHGVEEKPGVERPAPPFTTSTLTQEASRKLGFSTERTMQAAQRLFQDGHISYHRTDSTTLSEKRSASRRSAIREMFGDDYYAGPRRYATKVKNAQEAHEAIRPTDVRRARRRRSKACSSATTCGSTS